MVSEPRKQSMASMETDYSKHTFILSMEDIMAAGAVGMLGIMGETAHLNFSEDKIIVCTVNKLGLQLRMSRLVTE